MMIAIEASILAADFTRLGEQAREAEQAGVEGLQIDVMDGRFVPNITFGADVVRALRSVVSVTLDVDLMIVEPEKHLEAFAHAGADRMTVHREACIHPQRVLNAIRELGIEAGVAISPGTPPSVLEDLVDLADVIQIMTVNPGFGGQPLISSQVDKIRCLRQMLDEQGRDVPIAVDGGINPTTAPLVVEAGATILVAGSSIYNTIASVMDNVVALRGSVAQGRGA